VTKDRLYTMQRDSRGRRSAQSAMFRIAEAFVRWIAPILAFTADEVWGYLPGERVANVLFATTADIDALLPADGAYRAADGAGDGRAAGACASRSARCSSRCARRAGSAPRWRRKWMSTPT
jgi:isoleucyl-tRNA synthetase